jgi:hypothetical protein
MNDKLESAFYETEEIMKLFACSINQISALEKRGTIPTHERRTKNSKQKKRWLKSKVNKKLGIEFGNQTITLSDLRKVIAEELYKLSLQNAI